MLIFGGGTVVEKFGRFASMHFERGEGFLVGAGDPESATDFCLYRDYVFVTGGSRGDDDPPPE